MNKLQLSRLLMIATILIIAGFQVYWLTRLYNDEKRSLKKEADVLFRDAVYKLQMNKFRNDSVFSRTLPDNLFMMDAINVLKKSAEKEHPNSKMVITMSSSFSTTFDTTGKPPTRIVIDSMAPVRNPVVIERPSPGDFNKIIIRSSLGDSLSKKQLDSVYRKELDTAKIRVDFTIASRPGKRPLGRPKEPEEENDSLNTRFITVGLANPVEYRAEISQSFNYLLGKITYPILVSLLLITLTTASFVFLYRNLLAQRKLTELKNDFISNITHELKTPIATVNVAIEALKNFNAMENPARTKEYLDISSSELQRLSLLVDKVLKLSLFENKEIELKKEHFDLKAVAEEVIKTMQLQLQKKKATLNFYTEGDHFTIEGDKLHITSVIYNLLDNALKYSPEQPAINITITEKRNTIEMKVEDNGIGIPATYKDKIFEKFFRVPHGNMHNIKGYGLGLSYVHHVIQKHLGLIDVSSEEGKGSTFTINLLKEI